MARHLRLFENQSDYDLVKGDLVLPNVSYIQESGNVCYNPDTPFNGYEYVDLGLPSGTLWAKCNVGATDETESGLYFAWGETVGYTSDQVGTDKQFDWSDYKFSSDDSGTAESMTKYNSSDSLTVLELEDDAAHTNMGGSWRMPSKEQYEELINSSYTTTVNDARGKLITSKINGNTLIFPFSGACESGSVEGVGNGGGCWISSPDSSLITNSWNSSFDNGSIDISFSGSSRCAGFAVRGVISR